MISAFLARLSPWRDVPEVSECEQDCGQVVADARSRRRVAYSTRREVDSLSDSLRAHGARNHFGESLERIYGRA